MVKDFIEVSWIPEEKIKITIPELWNIASSPIPIALTMALENGEIQRGDKLVFIWFAAGAPFGIMFLKY
jgi:3-oxoacyl-[acyl-carrier-protein] synthase III